MSTESSLTAGQGATQSTSPAAGAGGAGSAGGAAAADIGGAIKSGWNVFHGAGESIRGGINQFLDTAGEQVAGRGGSAAHPQTMSNGGETPAMTSSRGEQEVKQVMESLSK